MIEITELGGPGRYRLHLSGKIRDDDYEDILIPALDRAIEENDRIRALVVMDDDVDFSIEAMLDDAEFGLRHWRGFERVAVVGGPKWITRAIRGFAVLMPCPVQTFAAGKEDDARRWLTESFGAVHQTDLGNGALHVALIGKLEPAAFEHEEGDMDAFVRRNDRFRLLVDLREFDGWQGLGALWQHLTIARDHYRLLDRVAVVGDAGWQKLALKGLGRLSGAEARYFDSAAFAEARDWVTA